MPRTNSLKESKMCLVKRNNCKFSWFFSHCISEFILLKLHKKHGRKWTAYIKRNFIIYKISCQSCSERSKLTNREKILQKISYLCIETNFESSFHKVWRNFLYLFGECTRHLWQQSSTYFKLWKMPHEWIVVCEMEFHKVNMCFCVKHLISY